MVENGHISVCMYIRTYTCTYIYVHVHTYTCTYIYMCKNVTIIIKVRPRKGRAIAKNKMRDELLCVFYMSERFRHLTS